MTKKHFWHNQELFTELLAGFNIRIKVYEKETFSVCFFPSLFSLLKTKCFFFLTEETIPESIRDLPLNKNTEFNQNMFSNKLGAMSVYKFKMIIKLPIRWLGCPPATVHPYHKAWARDQPELVSTRRYPHVWD